MECNKKNKIVSSSLVESVMSITIISIIILLATIMFSNLLFNIEKEKVLFLMSNKIDEIQLLYLNGSLKNQNEWDYKNYVITSEVVNEGNQQGEWLAITVLRGGKVVLEQKSYIPKQDAN